MLTTLKDMAILPASERTLLFAELGTLLAPLCEGGLELWDLTDDKPILCYKDGPSLKPLKYFRDELALLTLLDTARWRPLDDGGFLVPLRYNNQLLGVLRLAGTSDRQLLPSDDLVEACTHGAARLGALLL
jgi:hypothetical protein